MIEFTLTSAGAHRVRFAISPLEEALAAVQAVLGLRRHPAHASWVSAARSTVDGLPIRELLSVLSDDDYMCDFLSPPPEGPETTVGAQLDQVRRTPPAQVAMELAMLRAATPGLPTDPGRARDLLADQLEILWSELLAEHWPRMRTVLAADIGHRATRLADGGLALAIADLNPRVRLVEGNTLVIRSRFRFRCGLDRRGLLLVPSVFAWPKVGVLTVAPWPPALAYPARGVGALWAGPPVPAAGLVGVVGRTKAALLGGLDEPAGPTDLAAVLGLSPGTVSEHLTALRAGGLLAAERRGRRVLYARTELGNAVTAGRLGGP